MWTRRAFTALASIGAAAASQRASAQSPAPPSGRRVEIEALRRFAETTHPRGKEAAADADWRGRWDSLAADADRLSDGAYFLGARRALGWFKDGHTSVPPFEHGGGLPERFAAGALALSLPLRVQAFHDGAFVTHARGAGAPLKGARVTRIGAADTVDLMRAWARDWPGSDAWAHRWAIELFRSPALLQALGAIQDPAAPILVEGLIGRRRVRATLRPAVGANHDLEQVQRAQTQQEQWASEAGVGNFARVLPEREALYFSVDAMGDEANKPFEAFVRECAAALESPNVNRVLIDLRRNGGGNNYLMEGLRKRLLRSRFNRPGGIYVLTSPATFSAAQNPCTRLERDTQALFVGEPTGGSPNHYGDAARFVGEATGMTAFVSTIPWFDSYPQDRRVWIMPDLPAPALFEDWRSGRDAALEAALAHTVPQTPIDPWEDERVFFFGRDSQDVAWRPFWREA